MVAVLPLRVLLRLLSVMGASSAAAPKKAGGPSRAPPPLANSLAPLLRLVLLLLVPLLVKGSPLRDVRSGVLKETPGSGGGTLTSEAVAASGDRDAIPRHGNGRGCCCG